MSAAYSDLEVNKNPYIHQLLFSLAKQLSKGKDAHAVYHHLRQELRGYTLGNRLKMPEANYMSWHEITNKMTGKVILNPFGKNNGQVSMIAIKSLHSFLSVKYHLPF
ncbi:hypothetical protein BW727_101213 [Jeotgalibaca dankookensis]|uniref:Uncharacterized protein n=1 Tax=Jeotgalibaca dankookensis TaxID=708126 RepID=A0A1S6IQ36_9LACT|nr:hypothetical protein BW727_101213 [Jeotgalibaca dankookensis]